MHFSAIKPNWRGRGALQLNEEPKMRKQQNESSNAEIGYINFVFQVKILIVNKTCRLAMVGLWLMAAGANKVMKNFQKFLLKITN